MYHLPKQKYRRHPQYATPANLSLLFPQRGTHYPKFCVNHILVFSSRFCQLPFWSQTIDFILPFKKILYKWNQFLLLIEFLFFVQVHNVLGLLHCLCLALWFSMVRIYHDCLSILYLMDILVHVSWYTCERDSLPKCYHFLWMKWHEICQEAPFFSYTIH